MPESAEIPERPTTKLYAKMVEVYADQDKIDHEEAAAWLGLDRSYMEWGYRRGWTGGKKYGLNALLPIKDVISRMRFRAQGLASELEKAVTNEGERELTEALRDGTVKRALENLVSRSLLKTIQEQADNAMAMTAATKPLVDRFLSNIRTMETKQDVTISEIKAEIGFVQSYTREAIVMAERYHALEKTRGTGSGVAVNAEDKDKDSYKKRTESELMDEFAALVSGIQEAIGFRDQSREVRTPKPRVIDVVPEKEGK